MWVLAATTGVRRSELAHVDRDSVDLARVKLEIRLTRVVVAGRAQESDEKTENSRRAISLDTLTVDALKSHIAMLDDEREAFGDAYPGHGLLFVYPDGRPLHPERSTFGSIDWWIGPACRGSAYTTSGIHTPPCRWTRE
jgi:integrase